MLFDSAPAGMVSAANAGDCLTEAGARDSIASVVVAEVAEESNRAAVKGVEVVLTGNKIPGNAVALTVKVGIGRISVSWIEKPIAVCTRDGCFSSAGAADLGAV